MLESAIWKRLSTDATLAAGLALFDFGDGPAPAVFAHDPAPYPCAAPLVTIYQEPSEIDDTRGNPGFRMVYRVTLWGDRLTPPPILRGLAWRINLLLHRHAFTGTDLPSGIASMIPMQCDPPQNTTDPDGFPGYFIYTAATIWREGA